MEKVPRFVLLYPWGWKVMSSYRPAKLRVLVVDDEAPARSELKYLLEKTGKVDCNWGCSQRTGSD